MKCVGKAVCSLVWVGYFFYCSVSCQHATSLPGTPAGEEVRIVSGAYSDSGTRVEYEGEDGSGVHRVVWSAEDELYVAAFSSEGRVNASGKLWSRFGMVADEGFNKEYMRFTGEALIPDGNSAPLSQRLYAFYPASALRNEQEDEIVFPTVQRYVPGSFDTEAVVLVSAPVTAEIPLRGSVETPPFRMRHYTGYLRLFLKGMPDAVAAETVSKIVVEASSAISLSGMFKLGIDDNGTNEWTLSPAGENSSHIEVSYENAGVTVGELSELWIAMLPGVYGEITFTVHTDTGSLIKMTRSGLEIKAGIIKEQSINFRDDDGLYKAFVLELDGNDLGIGSVADSAVKCGNKDGVDFSYNQLRAAVSGDEKMLELSRRGAKLWNTSPFPSPIVRVELDHADNYAARFTYVGLGASLNYDIFSSCSQEGMNFVYAPDDTDCRYLCIENRNSSKAPIRNIRIICAPVE